MYDARKAEQYWDSRVDQTDQLSAVLSLALPDYMNEAYSDWEIACVLNSIESWSGREVLDLGCGVGRVTIPLAAAGARVTAVDNSQRMLELCATNLERAGLHGNVALRKGSATELPFSEGSFDVVCCLGLLEHLPADVRSAALQEIVRVIRKHAVIVIVVNNTKSGFLRRESLYKMDGQQSTGYYVSLVGKEATEQFFTERGFNLRSRGTNLFQSLAKHVLKSFLPIDEDRGALTDLLKLCCQLDLQFRNKGDLDQVFADQYVLNASRSSAT